jgi:hypothetical protein
MINIGTAMKCAKAFEPGIAARGRLFHLRRQTLTSAIAGN